MFDDHVRAAPADFASHIGERFDIWRIIIGTALVSVLYVALISGLSLLGFRFFPDLADHIILSDQGLGHSPVALAGLFVTFIPVWIG
ncbi:MAG: hypothetical protein HN582_06320, partial [Marinovum sp.]|nr:hypothetical protein [Marinovum sp.]